MEVEERERDRRKTERREERVLNIGERQIGKRETERREKRGERDLEKSTS